MSSDADLREMAEKIVGAEVGPDAVVLTSPAPKIYALACAYLSLLTRLEDAERKKLDGEAALAVVARTLSKIVWLRANAANRPDLADAMMDVVAEALSALRALGYPIQ